jgi:hypothetical protein
MEDCVHVTPTMRVQLHDSEHATLVLSKGLCGREFRCSLDSIRCIDPLDFRRYRVLSYNQLLPECPSCLAKINEQIFKKLNETRRKQW